MSHVHELYRQEALGLISSREFDRRFDDAVEQDIINSMPPHDRKHELNPGRMDLKGGHRHNHIKNAHKRMRKCHVCEEQIVKGCEVISDWTNAEFMCRECCRNDAEDYCSAVGIHFGGVTFITRRRRK